jgi:hypothetical protein
MPLLLRIARPSGKTGPSSADDQIRELAVNADCQVLPGLTRFVLHWRRPNLAETSRRQQISNYVKGTAADLFSEPIAIGRWFNHRHECCRGHVCKGQLRVLWYS